MRMTTSGAIGAVMIILSTASTASAQAPWTVSDLFSGPTPFAIGHRGFGVTDAAHPTPMENSAEAQSRGYQVGADIIEVDVVLTADDRVVAYHDDFALPTFACLNTMSFEQANAAVGGKLTTLRRILRRGRLWSQHREGGLVIIELKAPSPLCDGADTSEQALVDAVIDDVYGSGMEDRVVVESFSPRLLDMMRLADANIPRVLSTAPPQFVPDDLGRVLLGIDFGAAASIEEITKETYASSIPGAPELRWVEAGVEGLPFKLLRLPSYADLNQMLAVATALQCHGVDFDLAHFSIQAKIANAPPGSTPIEILQFQESPVELITEGSIEVGTTKASGLSAWAYFSQEVRDASTWQVLQLMNVDAIYADDVALGVSLE